ncbi:DUF1697 domain-containing protein [Cellulophaga fucicola]|uniref:DUF1697 domain-containing protein n=1 Tax=Cellulophaga fucicola TaxID=76595 RepID=UPI003EBCA5CB
MITYIALLRGINVSGKNKILMADLKQMLLKLKLANVTTYIQSGNVVFTTDEVDVTVLSEKIKKEIFKVFGLDVPVLVLAASALQTIFKNNPFTAEEEKETYFVLLKSAPNTVLISEVNKGTYATEKFVITNSCIYLRCLNGAGKAKCNNNFFERKLKVQATTRNYKTMVKLIEISETLQV